MVGIRAIAVAAAVGAISIPTRVHEQTRVFRSGVEVVPLHAAVTRDGRPVLDLQPADIEILDNGQPVDIALFSQESPAIAIKVLIDHSNRMEPHTERARAATVALFDALGPDDRAGVATLRFPGSPFTGDRNALVAALDRLLAQPRLRNLNDKRAWMAGMRGAITQFDDPKMTVFSLWRIPPEAATGSSVPRTVRALVVLSSGMDYRAPGVPDIRPDLTGKEETTARLVREGYSVFGVGFGGERVDKSLKSLAERSGGWFLHPKRDTDVAEEVAAIIADLRQRYILGFVPPVADGKDHRIEVRVNRPGVLVRTRTLYRAPGSATPPTKAP